MMSVVVQEDQHGSRRQRGLLLLSAGHVEEALQYLVDSLQYEGPSAVIEAALAEARCLLDQQDGRDEDDDEYEFVDDDADRDVVEAAYQSAHAGMQELSRGHLGRAIMHLRDAVKVCPHVAARPLVDALMKKAATYMERGAFHKAIHLYNECLRTNDGDADVYSQRAVAQLAQGNSTAAQLDFLMADRIASAHTSSGRLAA
ncbi:unnamed protein product (mitochondrion) [Plasmodiophora brassicae]|uniref:Uncharacterized protein n=1 Tax=Plasmodiophora brassicae TaxID=37360 RepID=A0A0G4J7S0_PLABS|nr:hypothetical protein PBRA_009513 [Plasmodiophora brassicae]SPQ99116.1 unnamed protein product [Plasmodiophora brassicae]